MRNVAEPYTSARSITPHDTDSVGSTRGLYVEVSGDVKVDMIDGTTITFPDLPAAVFHPIAVRRVYSTGTLATGIIALY
jgi:hypothetical protein